MIYVRGLSVQDILFWHLLHFVIDIKYMSSYSLLDFKLGGQVLLPSQHPSIGPCKMKTRYLTEVKIKLKVDKQLADARGSGEE